MHSQSWAARMPVQASHDSTVPLGRCGFSPLAFVLFFYFLKKFKSRQTLIFCTDLILTHKNMKQILLDRS
jgi:hypothetical protein